MLLDRRRVDAYVDAIRKAVRPGSIVLELGTGTGFMALVACQAGAARVHAVEPNSVIHIGRKAARDNGFADRIVFHPTVSGRLELPERCDVLISDMRGTLPFAGSHLADLIDARERLLTPDATWICQRDRVHVAVASLAASGQQFLTTWDGSPWGVDLSSAVPHATNGLLSIRPAPSDLLSAGREWIQIDYPRLQTPHGRGQATLEIQRDDEAHGLVFWFGAELFGGAEISTAPGVGPHVYGNMFLPWTRPVALRCGDRVEVRLDAISAHGTYEWCWHTVIWREGVPQPVAEFRQSRFQGRLIEPGRLSRRFPAYVPRPTKTLEIEKFILGQIDGKISQGQIAADLRERFPDRFATAAEALAYVVSVVEQLQPEE